jgi:hypothetical protein
LPVADSWSAVEGSPAYLNKIGAWLPTLTVDGHNYRISLSLVVPGVVVMDISMFLHINLLKHLELKKCRHTTRWSPGPLPTVMLQMAGIPMTISILPNIF